MDNKTVSQYIQEASYRTPTDRANRHVSFTNLSSQQLNPGTLVQFFSHQTKLMPMPFNDSDLPDPDQDEEPWKRSG